MRVTELVMNAVICAHVRISHPLICQLRMVIFGQCTFPYSVAYLAQQTSVSVYLLQVYAIWDKIFFKN